VSLLTVRCFMRDGDDYGEIRKQPTIFHHTARKQLISTNLTNGQDIYLRSSENRTTTNKDRQNPKNTNTHERHGPPME